MSELKQISEEHANVLRSIALGNTIDENLCPIDITSLDNCYLSLKCKVYEDPIGKAPPDGKQAYVESIS